MQHFLRLPLPYLFEKVIDIFYLSRYNSTIFTNWRNIHGIF